MLDDAGTSRGKLDAMTMLKTTVVADSGDMVNGPEDRYLDWDAVHWPTVEDEVRRLRQRIFAASQAGDLKRVRNLQKLMLRSRSNGWSRCGG
jgi:RNA-directed DNA polymerase